MRINGNARWISAIAASVVAGALLTGGIVQAITWIGDVDEHVTTTRPLIAENTRKLEQIERIVVWLARIQCTELMRHGHADALPPDCSSIKP